MIKQRKAIQVLNFMIEIFSIFRKCISHLMHFFCNKINDLNENQKNYCIKEKIYSIYMYIQV